MADKTICVAQIPARAGSKRVPRKNLRIMADKPMIQHAIEAALNSKVDAVYVNSDSDEILMLAESLGAHSFYRSETLASDSSTQDEFNQDFLQKVDCDSMVLVNPVCPLTSSQLIDSFIDFTRSNNFETCLTTVRYQLHAFFEGESLNFNSDDKLPPTQEISPVEVISWNLAFWTKNLYLANMEKFGSASTRGKLGLFPIDPMYAVKVSYEADFVLAESLLRSRAKYDLQ